jgi:hypothetical protein
VVERDPTCCGKVPLQTPQWRHSLSLVGGELLETNPCVPLWFVSLSCFLAYLICFRLDLLRCAWVITLLVIIYQVHSPSLVCERSMKLFLQVLCGAPVWPVQGNGLTGATCRVEQATNLKGQPHRSDRRRLAVQVGCHAYSPPSRLHQGPFSRLQRCASWCGTTDRGGDPRRCTSGGRGGRRRGAWPWRRVHVGATGHRAARSWGAWVGEGLVLAFGGLCGLLFGILVD